MNKVLVLVVGVAFGSLGASYESLGTLDQYDSTFTKASTSPTDVINALKDEPYVYAQRLQFQSEFSLSDVDNFVDRLERLEEQIERSNLDNIGGQEIITEFDEVLKDLGEAEALEFHSKIYFPYFPINFKTNGHHFSSFFEVEAGASLSFMDAPLLYDAQSKSILTESAALLKTYTHTSFGVDYSTMLIKQKEYTLSGGLRVNGHHVGLYKELRAFDAERDEDVEDLILQDYDDVVSTSLKVGIDASLRFENKDGVIVLGIRNINEPSFHYNKVSDFCSVPEYVGERDCESANYFIDNNELSNADYITLNRQAYAQATHLVPFWNLRVSGYLEANKTRDLLKDWTQMARGEISYGNQESWINGGFVAYERNLVGGRERRIVAGVSIFKRIQFVGYSSTETIREDGRELPEDFGFSLTLNTSF